MAGLVERVRKKSRPLRRTEDLDALLERVGDARCVLLGEASHGTSDYLRVAGDRRTPLYVIASR